MAGETAFVTGAARGLGREIAVALGKRGHRLYLADILADRLEQTAADLRADGYDIATRSFDVSSRAEVRDAVADCVARFGSLAVLVACAAITRFDHFTEASEKDWDRMLAVNLSGPFFLTQAALPHIVEAQGNIVNIASSGGILGSSYIAPYAATKAAQISLTKSLAVEYAEAPIRVNAVCPGAMATEIASELSPPPTLKRDKIARYSGLRGVGDAAHVASVVAFLASDEAAGVHGAIWTADLGANAG